MNARLKAHREIGAGEELWICYIDTSMDHDACQILLFQEFGFRCNCLGCFADAAWLSSIIDESCLVFENSMEYDGGDGMGSTSLG